MVSGIVRRLTISGELHYDAFCQGGLDLFTDMFVRHHRACARQAMGERANITGLSNKLIAIPGAGHVPVSVALPTSQHYQCPFRCVVCGFRLLRLFSYGCCALVCVATAADQRHRGRRRFLPRPGARVHHRVDGPGTRGVSSQESGATV